MAMNPYKMVIAVANQKGGCAKTTTAVNLAAALAKVPASKAFHQRKFCLLISTHKETVQPPLVLRKRTFERQLTMCSQMILVNRYN